MQFRDGDDNMWYNLYDCTHHEKAKDIYVMFVKEVCRHVKNIPLPEFRAVKDIQFLNLLVSSWTSSKETIHIFKKLFKHLMLLI